MWRVQSCSVCVLTITSIFASVQQGAKNMSTSLEEPPQTLTSKAPTPEPETPRSAQTKKKPIKNEPHAPPKPEALQITHGPWGVYARERVCLRFPTQLPRGSKFSNMEALGPQYYTYTILWGIVPSHLGTRTHSKMPLSRPAQRAQHGLNQRCI